jgi:deoxyribose-phosphate aldolase
MDLSRYIEHTLLRPDATPEEVERHCREAVEHGLFAVCISPVYVALAKLCLRRAPVRIVTVAGFPFGSSTPFVKATEARQAVADGADEIDMVMSIGLALDGGWNAVEADVRTVRDAVKEPLLKVIIETGYFSPDEIVSAAEAVLGGGADFVKTSTGFGPRGASVADVELLSSTVRGRAQVKAAGGIRTAAAARELIEAGATRIGTSRGVELVTPAAESP